MTTEAHAWNSNLDVGHEAMDHEHHLQIALLSACVDAVDPRRPGMARRLADHLLHYSVVHFGSEELLMEGAAYPARDRHAGEHASFVETIREVQRAYAAGEEDLAAATAVELRAALGSHMNEADRRLAEHVRR